MKYLCSFILLLIFVAHVSAAQLNITALLKAVEKQPGLQSSRLETQAASIQLEQARAELYPKITAFGSYEKYNSPTNLRPMPPTEVNVAAGDSIPFSDQIERYGLKVEMPLFVKGLYTLADKVKQLQKISRLGYRLNVITRQAEVVSLDASLAYISHLNEAILARLTSLRKTRDDLQLAVKNGRTPESELIKIETSINILQKQQIDLKIQQSSLIKQLEQLTGFEITDYIPLTEGRPIREGSFLSEKQQLGTVAVAEKEVQRIRDQHYPAVKLVGAVTENYGTAYNTDESVNRSYNYIGITVSIPLFDRSLGTSIDLAKIRLQKERKKLAQLQIDLKTEAATLKRQLPLLDQSQELARKSFENSRQILKIAKVAYRTGRTTTEEYLRNETEVLDTEAALYQINRDRWQIICRQAVLFGDDLKGVVK